MIQSIEIQTAKSRAALLSIASNTILIVLKLIVGIMMQSVSVISEAVHSGIDLVAAIIAWFSVRESGKPADDIHHFGITSMVAVCSCEAVARRSDMERL